MGLYDEIDAVVSLVKSIASGEADDFKKEIGKAVVSEVQRHYTDLNTEYHKGYSRTGFYAAAAKNTTMEIQPDGVEIDVNKTGLGLRIYGGVVTPGKNPSSYTGLPTKYLSIPAVVEAYGKSPAYFGNLRFVKFGIDGPAALIEKSVKGATVSSTGKKVRNKYPQAGTLGAFGQRVFYWLVKETHHKPDPSIHPDMDKVGQIAQDAAQNFIDKALAS
jgi:hypothetical protein